MKTVVSKLRSRSFSCVRVAGFVLAAAASAGCSRSDHGEVSADGTGELRQRLDTAVFINELHYDNAGADSAEAIELAGPAGTDLSGYSLILYNGATGAPYATLSLSGALPNQDDGHGTVSVAASGLQNGSPDGVALVGPSGLLQFLSYEGAFLAVSGPASGITSTDIGVSEAGTEPLGQSLQLTGTGAFYESFSWVAGAAASFGQVNAGQDFTGGGDVPPAVSATAPSDGATGVAVNTAISLSFTEPVSASGSWFAIECSLSGSHTATVSGGPQTFVLDPELDFAGSESCTVSLVADAISDLDGSADSLVSDFSFGFATAALSICGAPATAIHDVQGPGNASPLVGSVVTVEGVVVGDFQGSAGLGGFFIQEGDADADADPLTSEGLFVFQGNTGAAVSAGEIVRVTGTVSEFFELTELSEVEQLQICGSGASVTPVPVTLPVTALSDFERFEGSLVEFPQPLYATETFTQGRFGEVALSAGGRLMQPTHVAEPGAPAQAQQVANDLSRIQLDDGSNLQNPAVPPYLAADNTLRIGDRLDSLTGVLGFGFGVYEVHPTRPVSFARTNPRSATPPALPGSLKIASFNVLNYFTTLDTSSTGCGPTGALECRGANTASEFTRQRDKILAALTAINADIVGLIELENNATGAIQDLVNGLNSRLGAGTYAFVDTGTIGTDAIKVGLIYKPARVAPRGAFAVLDSSVDPRFIDTLNRPVLAQTFEQLSNGQRLTVAVNHLKSKGSACADDPDTGDGQGNCNLTRVAAAQAEVDWLAGDPTASGDPDFLLLGDMNAYAKEDPIDVFRAAGYQNLIEAHLGANSYSFVFQGQSGYLDHALASPALAAKVSGVSEWHINADEPVMLDYNQEFNPPFAYAPGPFRSADHDPVIVSLELGPTVPLCDGLPATVYVNADGRVVGGPLNGTPYRGALLGDRGANVIVGTARADLIVGGARSDVICGGEGNDVIEAGPGDDRVDAGAGNDVVSGGAGSDRLQGGPGNDALIGGAGSDECHGGAGTDVATACELKSGIP